MRNGDVHSQREQSQICDIKMYRKYLDNLYLHHHNRTLTFYLIFNVCKK